MSKVVVNKSYLTYLITRDYELSCLEDDGVDNWSGYLDSMRDFINESAKEILSDEEYQKIKVDIGKGYYFEELAEDAVDLMLATDVIKELD